MIAAQMDITNYFFCIPVLCNMVIGLFTDIHTRHLVDKLRLVSDPKVTVVREGKEINIPANQIVLNDVIIVSAGEQISSDAVLLTGSLEMIFLKIGVFLIWFASLLTLISSSL